MAMSSNRSRGLADEVQRTFRTLFAGLVLVALVLGGLSVTLFGFIQPDLRYDTELVGSLRRDHEAMLRADNGVRSWLATGDRELLHGPDHLRDDLLTTSEALLSLVGRDPVVDRAILELQMASQAWIDRWAGPSLQLQPSQLSNTTLAGVLGEGTQAFDRYQQVEDATTRLATGHRDDAMLRLQRVVGIGLATVVAIVLVIAVMIGRQRRRFERRLASPIRALIAGMEAIQRNEPVKMTDIEAPQELRVLARHLQDTSVQVRVQHEELARQRVQSENAARTLTSILTVAREIAGSLNVRYVAETVAAAAKDMASCERAVIWLTSDGADFVAVHDTSLGHGMVPPEAPVPIGSGRIGVAARDARPEIVDGSACFPLVVGGRVMGVLQLVGSGDLDATVQGSLETLTSHAAAALEAARLHRTTEELAQIDALTRLFNRRRMDDDMVIELERANRYGRPVGLILLDLDHFKALNDTFGHQHGDEVLARTGEGLASAVRSSDTVYRYGGEEFAVLVREGTRGATTELAERLRAEISRMFEGREGFAPVTASFGVAVAPEQGSTMAELIMAADGALYTAKAQGRDRVVVASPDADRPGLPGIGAASAPAPASPADQGTMTGPRAGITSVRSPAGATTCGPGTRRR